MITDEFQKFVNEKCKEGYKTPTIEVVDKLIGVATQAVVDFDDLPSALKITNFLKQKLCVKLTQSKDFDELLQFADFCQLKELNIAEVQAFWRVMLFEAQHYQLDSYLLYLEKNRNYKEKFYKPKRRKFFEFGLIEALQGMLDDKYDIVCISLIPSAGKTTLEKFFLSGVIGWYPKDYNLFYSHSGDITRMFYDGVYQMATDNLEYTWNEIFPDLKITQTNAKMQQFNVGSYKPFPSLQTASVGSENAGKVRASKFLCVDDMIGKIEEALNKNILDKLWMAYSVDARQRKTTATDGKFCKELHIATRWSVHDVIGRLQRAYEGNERVKVIAVPDIDPETGKSNFDYEIGGFTVKNFHDQQLLMDDISYRCLYKQDPIEREGLLYHEDGLRRYMTMPEEEPDAVVAICDTKTTGIDYMFMPIMYQYGEDYYLKDCICDDSTDFNIQYKRITDKILDNNIQQLEFESNAGGSRIAFEINSRIEKEGGHCNITTHPTETNKETRIIVNSDWVKKHVLFKERELYEVKSDYGRMMNFLLSYSVAGRNKFDDVPDGMAMFSEFITKRLYRRHMKTVIMQSPI